MIHSSYWFYSLFGDDGLAATYQWESQTIKSEFRKNIHIQVQIWICRSDVWSQAVDVLREYRVILKEVCVLTLQKETLASKQLATKNNTEIRKCIFQREDLAFIVQVGKINQKMAKYN